MISETRKKRKIAPWNKGKVGLQVAWNKGKSNIYSNGALTKMSKAKLGNKYQLGLKKGEF